MLMAIHNDDPLWIRDRKAELSAIYHKAQEAVEMGEDIGLTETYGGSSPDARQGRSTTILTLEMDTTVISSLLFQLGVALEELDTHINTAMTLRGHLLSVYNSVAVGVNGLIVAEHSD